MSRYYSFVFVVWGEMMRRQEEESGTQESKGLEKNVSRRGLIKMACSYTAALCIAILWHRLAGAGRGVDDQHTDAI